MKFLLKILAVVILFFISFIVFLPKQGMYNLIEEKLFEKNVIISGELVKEKSFGLKLTGAEIYYDGINTAFLKKLNLRSYLFYSKLEVYDLRISKSFENMLPSKILNIDARHSVLKPNVMKISANGDFGSFKGELKIFEKVLVGELKPSDIMKSRYRNILREFKLVEGKYLYEYKF